MIKEDKIIHCASQVKKQRSNPRNKPVMAVKPIEEQLRKIPTKGFAFGEIVDFEEFDSN